MRHSREAFPAGLYGMLLVAVFGLTLPPIVAPAERVLVGVAALLPRLVGSWAGTPAAAAEPAVLERLAALRADLDAAVQHHDVYGAQRLLPGHWRPVVSAVVATERVGGAGQPSVVRLDRTYGELAGCSEFVTKGDALLGFLLRPGVGLAVADTAADFARVQLLNDRAARRVAAAMAFPGGGSLRMIIGPAARVDVAALRAELWDDPYRASAMKTSGHAVHTVGLPGTAGEPPGGLLLGRTLIFGYAAVAGSEALTIGVFVEPPIDPAALSHVVLWHMRDGPSPPPPPEHEQLHGATVHDLPGVAGRHLVSADVAVPDGAAVVQDGLCLGTARGLSFGTALVTSFSASRHDWSLLLLPEVPGERPRELVGRVLQGSEGRAVVEFRADRFLAADGGLPSGYLFTGSNGPHCPAGLLLGSARPVPGSPDRIEVTLPVMGGPRAAEIVVQGERR